MHWRGAARAAVLTLLAMLMDRVLAQIDLTGVLDAEELLLSAMASHEASVSHGLAPSSALVGFAIPTMFCSTRALTIARTWARPFVDAEQLFFVVSSEDRLAYRSGCVWGSPVTLAAPGAERGWRLERFDIADPSPTGVKSIRVLSTKCPKGIHYVACAFNEALLFVGGLKTFSWIACPEDDVWVHRDAFVSALALVNVSVGNTPAWRPPDGCAGSGINVCGAFHDKFCDGEPGAKRGGPFDRQGHRADTWRQDVASGFFMVNSAAFRVLRGSLANDALTATAEYGSVSADLAVSFYVGSFGLARILGKMCTEPAEIPGCAAISIWSEPTPPVNRDDARQCVKSTRVLDPVLIIHQVKWDYVYDLLQAATTESNWTDNEVAAFFAVAPAKTNTYWGREWFPIRSIGNAHLNGQAVILRANQLQPSNAFEVCCGLESSYVAQHKLEQRVVLAKDSGLSGTRSTFEAEFLSNLTWV
jgi:hypothetical protein